VASPLASRGFAPIGVGGYRPWTFMYAFLIIFIAFDVHVSVELSYIYCA